MTKISDFRLAIREQLDALANTYGETSDLTPSQIDEVSYAIDEANETTNPNLPQRPK